MKSKKKDGLPLLFEKLSDCCGCEGCAAGCPNGAIFMTPDPEGYLYPVIDASKCILCGKCVMVCPMNETSIRSSDLNARRTVEEES